MARQDKIGSHKTVIYNDNGFTCVKYHETDVVKFNQDEIILNNGGFLTPTTKTRMNQCSNQFNLRFKVYQISLEWKVDFKGKTYLFYNNMTLTR